MLVCVHHLDPPACGHAEAALARSSGLPVHHVDRAAGEGLPDLATVDAIVSFGAAQSVRDAGRDRATADEARWLAEAVERGTPTLGVCFGAQLLAHALGGRVLALPRRRLVWSELRLTADGRRDPIARRTPDGAHALYWNEDGFEPPPGSVELFDRDGATTAAGFRLGEHTWGVQFHPEVDAAMLEHWYANWPHALDQAGVSAADARRADQARLDGQPPLSAAIFGGFAETVRALAQPPKQPS